MKKLTLEQQCINECRIYHNKLPNADIACGSCIQRYIELAQEQQRKKDAAKVRKWYKGVCSCEQTRNGPHRLSCDAGIGDDIVATITGEASRNLPVLKKLKKGLKKGSNV